MELVELRVLRRHLVLLEHEQPWEQVVHGVPLVEKEQPVVTRGGPAQREHRLLVEEELPDLPEHLLTTQKYEQSRSLDQDHPSSHPHPTRSWSP